MKKTPLSSKIPNQLREELADDKFMQSCCLSALGGCFGRIEWHHNLIYAGKRQNQRFCILPVCSYHHKSESKYKKYLNYVMLNRSTKEELDKFPRVNWDLMKSICTKF